MLEKLDIYLNAIFKENPLFQLNFIRAIKFKLPKNPVHASGRDFTSYLFTIHSSLLYIF